LCLEREQHLWLPHPQIGRKGWAWAPVSSHLQRRLATGAAQSIKTKSRVMRAGSTLQLL
jgi:hypothetical protein